MSALSLDLTQWTQHPKSSLTGNFTLDFNHLRSCASSLFLQTLGPWLPNKSYFAVLISLLFLLSPGKTLLLSRMVALDAQTPASADSLWCSPQFPNWLCLTILSGLRSSLLVMHIFLTHSSLPVNFPWICFAKALCQQPAFSAMTFCGLPFLVEGVSECLLDHCQVSSLSHQCD